MGIPPFASPPTPSTFLSYANPNGDSNSVVQASGYFNSYIASVGLASGWLIFDQHNNVLMEAIVTAGVVTVLTTGSGAVAAITSGTISGVTLDNSVIGGSTPAPASLGSGTTGYLYVNCINGSPTIPAIYCNTATVTSTTWNLAFKPNITYVNGPTATGQIVFRTNDSTVGGMAITWNATLSVGQIGIGTESAPNSRFQLAAGAATAGSAPLSFTSGTSLTTPIAGAMEYDGVQLYFSPSTTRLVVCTLNTATSGAGSSAGTLTNAPSVGNPTKWYAFNDNGTTRYIPMW